jgi:hypothetical protein
MLPDTRHRIRRCLALIAAVTEPAFWDTLRPEGDERSDGERGSHTG